MKKISVLAFVSFLFCIGSFRPVQGQELKVDWCIGMDNDSLEGLSIKLLQAISQDKIQVYDVESDRKISKKNFEEKLKPLVDEDNMLKKEEAALLMHCGDYSIMPLIETTYSIKEIEKLAKHYTLHEFTKLVGKGEKLEHIFEMKKFKPFETYMLSIGITEKLTIDTTLNIQRGTIEYINLLLPRNKEFGKHEIIGRVAYKDFKKLNLSREQKVIEERGFVIHCHNGDIVIVDQNKSSYRLSELRTLDGRMVEESKVDNSIFKYFKGSIIIFDPRVSRQD